VGVTWAPTSPSWRSAEEDGEVLDRADIGTLSLRGEVADGHVLGPATRHGFDPSGIVGVRRLMEINSVQP
jgi:hypothetical protein